MTFNNAFISFFTDSSHTFSNFAMYSDSSLALTVTAEQAARLKKIEENEKRKKTEFRKKV